MTVTLTAKSIGDREFTYAHAKRLMNMPNNGGWKFKNKKDESKVMGNGEKSDKNADNGNIGNPGSTKESSKQKKTIEGDKP